MCRLDLGRRYRASITNLNLFHCCRITKQARSNEKRNERKAIATHHGERATVPKALQVFARAVDPSPAAAIWNHAAIDVTGHRPHGHRVDRRQDGSQRGGDQARGRELRLPGRRSGGIRRCLREGRERYAEPAEGGLPE